MFNYLERREGDDPSAVFMWASAVLRQADRYEQALDKVRQLEKWERICGGGEPPVTSDHLFQTWAEGRAELHFLLEAGVQMCRWATVGPPRKSWEKRTRLYDVVPELKDLRWLKILRDLLTHYDEVYRGHGGRAAEDYEEQKPELDIAGLVRIAREVLSYIESHLPEPDWELWDEPEEDVD